MHYKTVFISDTHIGSKKCKIDHLLNFLESNTFDKMYLVGDIIDIWRFKQFHSMSKRIQNKHMKAISLILEMSTQGTKVIDIIGNHDEAKLHMFSGYRFGNIKFCEQHDYIDSQGKTWKVIHGHQYDLITKYRFSKTIGKIGDRGYDFLIYINEKYNKIRRLFGKDYWSLSLFLKRKVKKAANFLQRFEDICIEKALHQGYDGVITGHVHDPKLTSVYANCGCWTDIENLSFLYDNGQGIKLQKWESKL